MLEIRDVTPNKEPVHTSGMYLECISIAYTYGAVNKLIHLRKASKMETNKRLR